MSIKTTVKMLQVFLPTRKYNQRLKVLTLFPNIISYTFCHCPVCAFVLVLVCHRSGPAPSPKTRTRVTTMPATVSSFTWTLVMRFSLNWMEAKLTGATATSTAPFQDSFSMLTEDEKRQDVVQSSRIERLQPEGTHHPPHP